MPDYVVICARDVRGRRFGSEPRPLQLSLRTGRPAPVAPHMPSAPGRSGRRACWPMHGAG